MRVVFVFAIAALLVATLGENTDKDLDKLVDEAFPEWDMTDLDIEPKAHDDEDLVESEAEFEPLLMEETESKPQSEIEPRAPLEIKQKKKEKEMAGRKAADIAGVKYGEKKLMKIAQKAVKKRMTGISPQIKLWTSRSCVLHTFRASEYMNIILDAINGRFLPNPKTGKYRRIVMYRHQLRDAAKVALKSQHELDQALHYLLGRHYPKHTKQHRLLQDLMWVQQHTDHALNKLLLPLLYNKMSAFNWKKLETAQIKLEEARDRLDGAMDYLMRMS